MKGLVIVLQSGSKARFGAALGILKRGARSSAMVENLGGSRLFGGFYTAQ